MKDTRKPEGAVLGYGRVSREGRTWRSSVPCTRLFEEKASGGRWDRPELQRLLDHLRLATSQWSGSSIDSPAR